MFSFNSLNNWNVWKLHFVHDRFLLPTNFPRVAESFMRSQQVLSQSRNFRIVWKSTGFFYRFHNSPPPVRVVGHIRVNQVHAPHFTYWKPIFILASLLSLGLSSGLLPSVFPTKKPFMHLSSLSPVFHAPPTSLFLLGLISRIILRG